MPPTATVTVWVVDHTGQGDATETVARVLDYADALGAYRTLIEGAADALIPGGGADCTCGDQLCAYHSIEEQTRAYLRDEMPWFVRPAIQRPQPHQGTAGPLSCQIQAGPFSALYRVRGERTTYGQFIASSEGAGQ